MAAGRGCLSVPGRQRRFGALRLADVQADVGRIVEARPFGGVVRIPVIAGVGHVARRKVDHDHAAIGGHRAQNVVRNIARMIDQRARRGVREDHRRFARRQRGLHRFGRHMAEIHQHPEAIHFVDDFDAERRKTVMHGRIGRRVRPSGIEGVRQSHVARAGVVHLAQRGQRVVDLMAAFDADQRGDLVRLMNAAHICGAV